MTSRGYLDGMHAKYFCRTEKSMKPSSDATVLEGSEGFVEYIAAGKLKNKKALITGGEYV